LKAIVFGRFETGLGILRSLKDLGNNLYSVDYKEDVAFVSKYGQKLICPKPADDKALVSWLKEQFPDGGKVFISSDDFLDFFNRNREHLSFLDLEIPDAELLGSLQDKFFQYEVCIKNGINAPSTFKVTENLEKGSLPYPVFLKGMEVNAWRKHYGGSLKGFVINDQLELEEWMNEHPYKTVPTIAQSLIIGPDENHYKYCAYRNLKGEIQAEFMLQKLVQYPIGFGIGAATKSIFNEELLKQGRALFNSINYLGVGSAEFKLDNRDGKFKLIELNPRYWQQNYQATACGLNFPQIQYQSAAESIDTSKSYVTDVVWMNRAMVARALSHYLKKGLGHFRSRIKILKGQSKVYSHYHPQDKRPFYKEIQFGLVLLKLPIVLLKDFLKAS
jgi:predicted ATP-grasp superfamily ATP-dependent carboligase